MMLKNLIRVASSYGARSNFKEIDFHSSDEDFRLEVETSRYISVLVVLDEFYLAVIFDQMNLFVVIANFCFHDSVTLKKLETGISWQ